MRILFLATVLLCTISCKPRKERIDHKNYIATAKIPRLVRDSFTARYPRATDIIWEEAHEGTYQTYKAKFTMGDKFWKAEFKVDGSFVKGKEDETKAREEEK